MNFIRVTYRDGDPPPPDERFRRFVRTAWGWTAAVVGILIVGGVLDLVGLIR